MIDQAKERNLRVILMTQPTMWKADMPKHLEDLLWFGGIGRFQSEPGSPYYSVEALSKAMKMYNEELLKICRNRDVECIDLGNMLPKDTRTFYDDVHFNEGGAERVAEIVANYLLRNEPFKGSLKAK